MSRFSLDDLVAATGAGVTRRAAEAFDGVTIDGRATHPGDIYFAIQGENFDGHAFCAQAVTAGATALVVARGRRPDPASLPNAVTILEVDDPRRALGEVARAWRRRMKARVIGITGSTGKTTTKGLVAAMLAGVVGEAAVLATEGSLNNETGVPLTLLRLRPEHRFAVIEMGMRGVGQIDYLTQFAEPDVGVVVNVGVAHVGVVGSVDGIAEGKSEIWGRLAHTGRAVLPAGDARLGTWVRRRFPVGDPAGYVTFGREPEATVRVAAAESRGAEGSDARFAIAGAGEIACRVPLVGAHNVDNAACALAIAVALGVDLAAAARGLEQARPGKQRSELAQVAGRHVLVDCYNANPTSMRAALATLADLGRGKTAVAVLGDMLELGDTEAHEHEEIGAEVAKAGLTHLVCVGERARHIAAGATRAGVPHVVTTDDPAVAAQTAAGWTRAGDWILVKASRGMRLERVITSLQTS